MRRGRFGLMLVAGAALAVATGAARGQDERKPYQRRYSVTPDELRYCLSGIYDRGEEENGEAVAGRDPAKRVPAARDLWAGHSRRHARAVLKLLDGPATTPGLGAFKRNVNADLRPAAIAHELRTGDYLWGAWLAYLRPHPDLVAPLLAGLADRAKDPADPRRTFDVAEERQSTLLALGVSGDRRVVPPVLAFLAHTDDSTSGTAAEALGNLGATDTEPQLLAALAQDGGCEFRAVGALGKVGTRKSLPELLKRAESDEFTGKLDLRGAAMSAVATIERRHPDGAPKLPPTLPPDRMPTAAAVLRGHAGYVWSAAFSPDGKTVATASDDRTVRLWDAASGTPGRVLAGHAYRMQDVAFTPDGRLLTAGWGDDGSAQVYDLKTASVVGRIPLGDGGVTWMTVSPDGKFVAAYWTSGEKYHYRVRDVATGKLVAPLPDTTGALAFRPDGTGLAVGQHPAKGVRLWDSRTQKTTASLRSQPESPRALAFAPDGRTLAAAAGWHVRLLDVATDKVIASRRGDSEISGLAYSPTGQLLAWEEADGVIRLWDGSPGTAPVTLPGRGFVAFSPNGRTLATGTADRNTVQLWTLPAGK